jgi:hypothetical protein
MINKKHKYIFYTILNGIISGLISVILTWQFLDITDKSSVYLTFIVGLWIYFNSQTLLLKEIELSDKNEN